MIESESEDDDIPLKKLVKQHEPIVKIKAKTGEKIQETEKQLNVISVQKLKFSEDKISESEKEALEELNALSEQFTSKTGYNVGNVEYYVIFEFNYVIFLNQILSVKKNHSFL